MGGCSGGVLGLRFEPSQAQKQTAELTHVLAVKVDAEGTDPGSEASRRLVDGTATGLTYIGRPDVVPRMEDFDTINEEASGDAARRPTVDGIMDTVFDVGLVLASIVGGGAGVRLVTKLRTVYKKAKGFTEIVTSNELFKTAVDPATWEQYKATQKQSDTTKKLVAETTV